eukprot:SAG31_NODE_7398_length_1700_cov_1.829482_2_plen_85_part_00
MKIYEKGEVEPEKKIVISKVNFSFDIIDPKIPKPLFQNYNHFLILSAPPPLRLELLGGDLLLEGGRVCHDVVVDVDRVVSGSSR